MEYHEKIHKVLAEYTPKYAETAKPTGNHSSHSSKVQRTAPKGGFHTWHPEHGPSFDSVYRTLTWTLYLNDVPEGEGETEFLEFDQRYNQRNRLCYFPAAWTHTTEVIQFIQQQNI